MPEQGLSKSLPIDFTSENGISAVTQLSDVYLSLRKCAVWKFPAGTETLFRSDQAYVLAACR